jgi:hypothetical protein
MTLTGVMLGVVLFALSAGYWRGGALSARWDRDKTRRVLSRRITRCESCAEKEAITISRSWMRISAAAFPKSCRRSNSSRTRAVSLTVWAANVIMDRWLESPFARNLLASFRQAFDRVWVIDTIRGDAEVCKYDGGQLGGAGRSNGRAATSIAMTAAPPPGIASG